MHVAIGTLWLLLAALGLVVVVVIYFLSLRSTGKMPEMRCRLRPPSHLSELWKTGEARIVVRLDSAGGYHEGMTNPPRRKPRLLFWIIALPVAIVLASPTLMLVWLWWQPVIR
jgi:hypothetical protein